MSSYAVLILSLTASWQREAQHLALASPPSSCACFQICSGGKNTVLKTSS